MAKSHRTSFPHQPTQILLVDMGYPLPLEAIKSVSRAVQNILTLAYCIPGKTRIPNFGLATINNIYENILSPTMLKGSFPKVIKSLELLHSQAIIGARISLQEYKDLLNLSIKSIIENQAQQEMNKTAKFPSQAHLTFVTGKKGSLIQSLLLEAMEIVSTPSDYIRRVRVVEILKDDNQPDEGDKFYYQENYITWLTTTGNEFELDKIFKCWLFENEGENEHLTIRLSPDLILKCDVEECNINPSQIPFGHRFTLYNDVTSIIHKANSEGISGEEIPVFEFHVVNKVALSGLCPSFTFGNLLRIYPSRCWRLSWNESQINQKLFKALCKNLTDSEYGLLISIRNESKPNEMFTYYIVVSDGDKLLLNSVAPFELRYPERKFSAETEDEALSIINHALSEYPTLVEYTADAFPSKLYENLKPYVKSTGNTKKSDFNNSFRIKPSSDKTSQSVNKRKINNNATDIFHLVSKEPAFNAAQKRKKSNSKPTDKNIHPALLSPESKARYRKRNLGSFDLCEKLIDVE